MPFCYGAKAVDARQAPLSRSSFRVQLLAGLTGPGPDMLSLTQVGALSTWVCSPVHTGDDS